jgi:pilus assembly protein FimV
MLARNKALKIGLILVSELFFTQQLLAVELGDLVLESNLSEPLDATIELQDVAGLDPAQISVSLGTAEQFAGAGIEFSQLASQVQFAVEMDGATGNIHLTTQDAIEEPFLDLLLVVTWPNGTTQRDYTILLNLAGSTTTSIDSLVIPGTANTNSPADAETTQGDYGTGVSDDGQTYVVANGDSMWAIAARTRPNSGVSMQQMMLAIQRANEDAFINNNINRVLAGKVLRIPSLQEINLVDQDAAIAEVSQQNQQLGVQPLAVNRSTGNSNPAPEQDELSVLTDDQGTAAGGNGDLEATLASLESEVMLSEEGLDRARLENTELTNRFQMLEEEMNLLQNLITVEDARVAQLQADLATQAETAEEALATTEAATSVMAAQEAEVASDVTGGVAGWMQNTAVLMGVIAGLLLLVLGYLFWQRRRMDAAAYAFDSGIPELETVENSRFAPAEKTSGGLMGWLSRSRNKDADEDQDVDLAYDGIGAPEADARDEMTTAMQGSAVTGQSVQNSYFTDEEQMFEASSDSALVSSAESDNISNQTFQNETDTSGFAQTEIVSPDSMTAADEADLADALIAEAKGMDATNERHFASLNDHLESRNEAGKEAQELAELVTPDVADVAMTESEIPESFEFTLTTAPEALAEEASVAAVDDLESFDFQLSDSPAAEQEPAQAVAQSAEQGFGDDADFNALLLDEDEADFQASAPLNECDTKLDLAVAYEAMGDIEGAIEILDEVVADGDDTQIAEANRLKGLWQNS